MGGTDLFSLYVCQINSAPNPLFQFRRDAQGIRNQLPAHKHLCRLPSSSGGPFPAGLNDCIDGAEHLVAKAPELFGAPLNVLAGASAGGNSAAVATFQLMRSRPQHRLAAVQLNFGVFDLTMNIPSAVQGAQSLVVDRAMLEQFFAAYVGGASIGGTPGPGDIALWMGSGSEAFVKLYPGSPHCFMAFKGSKMVEEAAAVTEEWLREKLGECPSGR
ncbi:Carboxylesterase NlhH [Cytospora mali]|nr:Carboxylesterase NlhH [Valsa mali var. pyri (nom. inval.)]